MNAIRTTISGALFVATLLLNPMVACRGHGVSRATEMKAASTGTWELRLDGAPPRRLEFTAASERTLEWTALDWVAPAAACSGHTVIASAAACLDSWTMPLTVREVGTVAAAGVGEYTVDAKQRAELRFQVGEMKATARFARGRAVGTVHLETSDREGTLVRIGTWAEAATRP